MAEDRLLITSLQSVNLDSGVLEDVEIAIEGSQVVGLAVGTKIQNFSTDLTIAAHCLAVPGLVDLCAHLREPGYAHKAHICTELKAAVSAGITTLACAPDTFPVTDNPATVKWVQEKAHEVDGCDVKHIAALTVGLSGKRLSDMGALQDAGCLGFTNLLCPFANLTVLRRAMLYGSGMGAMFFLYPIEASLGAEGCAHENIFAASAGLPMLSSVSESIAVDYLLGLMRACDAKMHICRLSCAHSVDKIARAQEDGLPVTADVAVHQLILCDEDLDSPHANLHVIPPLRSADDRAGLQQGVRDGVIAAVCSDHQPHDIEAKNLPFSLAAAGVSAVETLFPLMMRCVSQGILSLAQAISAVSTNPARILGIAKFSLELQSHNCADLCLFDIKEQWCLTADDMLSDGKNSPFIGQNFQGKAKLVIVGGRVVYSRLSSLQVRTVS